MEDVLVFVQQYEKQIAQGDFDVYLDRLWNATDGRLREYFQEDGSPDAEQKLNVDKVLRMREAPEHLSVGDFYGIFGDQYNGVIVKFLGIAKESENNGHEKARVQICEGNLDLDRGKTYKIPTGALMSLGGLQSTYRSMYG
jgi:hypothetical protein